MEEFIGLVAVTGVFTCVFTFIYLFFRSRHVERMKMIEKGVDAGLLNKPSDHYSALKFGMVAIGIGLGLLLGGIISSTGAFPEELPFFMMIFICGGGSLVLYYYIRKKKEQTEGESA